MTEVKGFQPKKRQRIYLNLKDNTMYKTTFFLRNGEELTQAGEAIMDYQSAIGLITKDLKCMTEADFVDALLDTEERPRLIELGEMLSMRITKN